MSNPEQQDYSDWSRDEIEHAAIFWEDRCRQATRRLNTLRNRVTRWHDDTTDDFTPKMYGKKELREAVEESRR
jgi:hypothetical protein